MSKLTIQFLGAAGTVTGSKYLLTVGDKKLLIDCGLFQGLKELRLRNREPFAIPPREIDAVILTHAHLDHTGYLPRLVKEDFAGPVYCTEPTLDLTAIILRDSAKIQEEEAERANRRGYSKHHPATALYTLEDAEEALAMLRTVHINEWTEPCEGVRFRYLTNGHVLGSAYIELEAAGKRIIFSGDIGADDDPLLPDANKPGPADYVLLESTYGNRLHPNNDTSAQLADVVNSTMQNKGILIIPSFALERSQLVTYMLWQLRQKNAIPDVPIYMDSPMGSDITKLFHKYVDWLRISREECSAMCDMLQIVKTVEQSKQVVASNKPKIVIAGSGMITGGRVLHYLDHHIGKPSTTVLLVGYQAEGTRGRQLKEGAKEIKMFGRFIPVNARVEDIEGFSAHADQRGLIEWASGITSKPKKAFLVHGEKNAADALRVKLNTEKGWHCEIPHHRQTFELD